MKLDFYNRVLDFAKTHKKIAEQIKELKHVNSKSLLDVGGGSGLLTHYLEDEFEKIIIVEPSKSMTNHITNSSVTIINSIIQNWKSKDKFDTVVCFDSLHHVANEYKDGFEEVKNAILKMIDNAENEVIIIEPRMNSLSGFWIKVQENWILKMGSYFMSKNEFRDVLEEYNYSIYEYKQFIIVHIKLK
ncbi:MAG: methyltransferase domain-containing protein [Candidatus Nanoarchaeia archaeon]